MRISLEDDPTLSSTNLSETYDVKSTNATSGGSNAKLDFHEAVYNLEQYAPIRFMLTLSFFHAAMVKLKTRRRSTLVRWSYKTSMNPSACYSELKTLVMPDGSPAGHGAWEGVVDGKGLFEMSGARVSG